MSKRICLSICVMFSVLAYSRDFSQDMQKIRDTYDKKYISMNIIYSLYNKTTDIKPLEVNKLWLESFGNLLHYKGQGHEVMYTANNVLMVDEEEKEIVIDTVMGHYNQPNYDIMPLDTTVAKMQSITSEDLGGGIVRYILIPKDKTEASKAIFEINTNNWTISRIEIHSGSLYGGGKVVISYSNTVKQDTAPINSFKLSEFVLTKNGGGYVATLKYKAYKLYHRNEQSFKPNNK